MALSHIGAKSSIESLTEHSVEAETCNLHYDIVRQQLLEIHNWNFARRRRLLAFLGDRPSPKWAYRHEYPSDCIQVRYIESSVAGVDLPLYDVESSDDGSVMFILSNEVAPTLVYTSNVKSLNLFPSVAVNALSWALASAIAPAITGDSDLAAAAQQQYFLFAGVASSANAGESMSEVGRDAEWIRDN